MILGDFLTIRCRTVRPIPPIRPFKNSHEDLDVLNSMATDTGQCFNHGESRRVARSGRRGLAQRPLLHSMQDHDEDDDDDSEYQGRSDTSNTETTHRSDDETNSEDTQELYRLSSDKLGDTPLVCEIPPGTRSCSFKPPDERQRRREGKEPALVPSSARR
jgi:hypothetical protein